MFPTLKRCHSLPSPSYSRVWPREVFWPRRRAPDVVALANNIGILVVDVLVVRIFILTAAVGASLFAAGLDGACSASPSCGSRSPRSWLPRARSRHPPNVIFHKAAVLALAPNASRRSRRRRRGFVFILRDIDFARNQIAVVIALGIPAVAVLAFEVVLNATSMFNHSNAAMPRWLDRLVRLVVVTPDMHRVHHSVLRHETDSNFGFNLPWWDRLFRTYRAEPEAGHAGMTVGLPIFRDPRELRFDRLLTQPFRDEHGEH
jgi:sterol desaturase/sphingolipid hydroxylase (fatty acid hydroxylase superfamily)